MRMTLIVTVLIVFLLAACAKSVVCPDGTIVKAAENCPIVQQAQDQLDHVQKMADDLNKQVTNDLNKETAQADKQTEESAPPTMDSKIADLFANVDKVKSYSFLYAPIEMGSEGALPRPGNRFWRKGEKVKIKLPLPKPLVKEFADTVYLDIATKKAEGYCTEKLLKCNLAPEERPVSYNDYTVKWPDEWIDQVPATAHLEGSLQWENRQVQVIRYEKNNQYYELYVDTYYGLPLKASIYTDAEYTQLIAGGAEYRDIAINRVKESDVTP